MHQLLINPDCNSHVISYLETKKWVVNMLTGADSKLTRWRGVRGFTRSWMRLGCVHTITDRVLQSFGGSPNSLVAILHFTTLDSCTSMHLYAQLTYFCWDSPLFHYYTNSEKRRVLKIKREGETKRGKRESFAFENSLNKP